MASVKNLSGSYNINTPNSANVAITTGWVVINGNLEVLGNTATITTTNTNILDNIITLNYGEIGDGITKGNAGIIVDRGTLSNVEIRYNEDIAAWEATNDGTNYQYLLTGNSSVGLTSVYEDKSPVLGGNLNTDGNSIFANLNIVFSGNLQLNNTAVAPSLVSDTTILYSQPAAAGQSGVYVVNQDSMNEELITKRRALGFSMIL